MIRSCICHALVVVSFFNGVRAGFTTSDGFWTHESKLSTAATGSALGASLKSSSISAESATPWNLTSDCSTASISGTLNFRKPCRHIPGITGSSQSTWTQSITNTTLLNQATITTGATHAFGELISKVTAEPSAATSGISGTAQSSSSATTLTPLPSTYLRPSLLHGASNTSLNQYTGSSSVVLIAQSLSTTTISVALNLPAQTPGHEASDRASGTILATKTSSSLAIPTSATLSSSSTTAGNANATLSNATLAADTNELQNQLMAAVALTQTWVTKSTESNSHDAVNAINGTIFFAQVWTVSKQVNTTYDNIQTNSDFRPFLLNYQIFQSQGFHVLAETSFQICSPHCLYHAPSRSCVDLRTASLEGSRTPMTLTTSCHLSLRPSPLQVTLTQTLDRIQTRIRIPVLILTPNLPLKIILKQISSHQMDRRRPKMTPKALSS